MTNNDKNLKILEQQITVSRQRLQDLWDARGYTDSVVLDASIELDHLLNRYQKQKTKARDLMTHYER
jgi:hypothetical protein